VDLRVPPPASRPSSSDYRPEVLVHAPCRPGSDAALAALQALLPHPQTPGAIGRQGASYLFWGPRHWPPTPSWRAHSHRSRRGRAPCVPRCCVSPPPALPSTPGPQPWMRGCECECGRAVGLCRPRHRALLRRPAAARERHSARHTAGPPRGAGSDKARLAQARAAQRLIARRRGRGVQVDDSACDTGADEGTATTWDGGGQPALRRRRGSLSAEPCACCGAPACCCSGSGGERRGSGARARQLADTHSPSQKLSGRRSSSSWRGAPQGFFLGRGVGFGRPFRGFPAMQPRRR